VYLPEEVLYRQKEQFSDGVRPPSPLIFHTHTHHDSLSQTHFHTHTLSLSLSFVLSSTQTHTHSLPLSLSFSLSLSLFLLHTHILSLSLFLSLSPSLFRSPSFCGYDEEEVYLPEEVLYRQKEQFSDGVRVPPSLFFSFTHTHTL
jgi:hypothetical protein